ncbi:unnamed protein product [Candidula unifasciata]|uniref:Uncharacterized protein n=1 Tax=Candidula unifasciata TaxID=100452 RepID=A0A8S3Z9G8_9EUPU|nr:unnamed protein product [Candidula unifasciata]
MTTRHIFQREAKTNMDVNKPLAESEAEKLNLQGLSKTVSRTESDSIASHGEEAGTSSASFNKLQHAVQKCVKRITAQRRVLPSIKEHFQKVYRADSENVLAISKSMVRQLESMILEDIEMQLNACDVEELLGSLDKIKTENVSVQRKWRPSRSPNEDMKAHLQESSQKELKQLQKILLTLESQNKHLNECVVKSDDKLQESVKLVENLCSAWEEAALVLSDETRQKFLDANVYM